MLACVYKYLNISIKTRAEISSQTDVGQFGSLQPTAGEKSFKFSASKVSQHNSIKCLRIQRGCDMSQHVYVACSYLSVSAHMCRMFLEAMSGVEITVR